MLIGTIKEAPKMRISDIFAGLFFFLGLMLFLIALHILTIRSTGDTSEVLSTTFIIFLRIYITLLTFAIVGIIIFFLKYLVWFSSTPEWMRDKLKQDKPK